MTKGTRMEMERMVMVIMEIIPLVMVVMEKGKDIGILKAMGATRRAVMRIFVVEGLIIGCAGTIIGLVSGSVVCRLLDRYKFIKMPEFYYLETLPVRMEASDVFLIVLAAVVISFLATLYPSWSASRLDPVDALRYE